MNTELIKKAKKVLKEEFFELINNAVLGETMRKRKDIKLVTNKTRRNYLVSKPNYHTTIFFRKFISYRNKKKTQILMNKPVYLGLSLLELSAILIYDIWYDCVEPKYVEKTNLYYTNTDRFKVYIKTEDITQNLKKVFKKGLIVQIMNYTDHYQKEKMKK